MSKVKDYMDRKPKALHRIRRSETAHKKDVRRKKIKNLEYGGFYESRGWCGYVLYGGEFYYECDGEIVGDRWDDEFDNKIDSVGMSFVSDDGTVRRIVGIRKNHVKKINHGKSKKYHRHCAARHLRQMRIDEESYCMKGNGYKREYDLAWAIGN